MKVKLIVIILILSCSFLKVSAHPGNTNSNGGHSCFTNCSKWGYSFGEYHFHSSSSSSSSNFVFNTSYSDDYDGLIVVLIIVGVVVVLFVIASLNKDDSKSITNTFPSTTYVVDNSNKINIKSTIYYTNENISYYFEDKDLRDLSNYCKQLDKAYSNSSWFITLKGPITFIRLSGTTFENRQNSIKKIYEGQSVEFYREQDYSAVECFVNLDSIGVVPSERSSEVRRLIKLKMIKECYIESVRGGSGKNYGVIIALVLKDNIQLIENIDN